MACTLIGRAQDHHGRHIATLTVDNDMTFYTDRYYSSGVRLDVGIPAFKKSPVNKLLIPHSEGSVCYYALSLVHHLYTPEKIYSHPVPQSDHPYLSYMLLGSSKQAFNKPQRLMHFSELQIGLMGPVTGGEYIQTTIHENVPFADPPEGWDSQIQNDVCLQYTAVIEKGLVNLPWFEANAFLGGTIGSPHTNAHLGSYLRAGKFEDYFTGKPEDGTSVWQLWVYCSGLFYLVNYDASLQGGTYNQDNVHVIRDINQQLIHFRFGGALVFKQLKLELSQEVRSPEFPAGLWSRWVRLMISFRF